MSQVGKVYHFLRENFFIVKTLPVTTLPVTTLPVPYRRHTDTLPVTSPHSPSLTSVILTADVVVARVTLPVPLLAGILTGRQRTSQKELFLIYYNYYFNILH